MGNQRPGFGLETALLHKKKIGSFKFGFGAHCGGTNQQAQPQEAETDGSGVQSHPQLCREFQASLDCARLPKTTLTPNTNTKTKELCLSLRLLLLVLYFGICV